MSRIRDAATLLMFFQEEGGLGGDPGALQELQAPRDDEPETPEEPPVSATTSARGPIAIVRSRTGTSTAPQAPLPEQPQPQERPQERRMRPALHIVLPSTEASTPITPSPAVVEGPLFMRESHVGWGLARLLPSLLKSWTERHARLDVAKGEVRVWADKDAALRGDEPQRQALLGARMALSSMKLFGGEGGSGEQRIFYRHISALPPASAGSAGASNGGNGVGNGGGGATSSMMRASEAGSADERSTRVFKFGCASTAEFESWSRAFRAAIEAARVREARAEEETQAYEAGSRLNAAALLRRALASPSSATSPNSSFGGGRGSGFAAAGFASAAYLGLGGRASEGSDAAAESAASARSRGSTASEGQSSGLLGFLSAPLLAGAGRGGGIGAFHSTSAMASSGGMGVAGARVIALRIHLLDRSQLVMSLPRGSCAFEACLAARTQLGLQADADFSLFIRQPGDEATWGRETFTCVPDLMGVVALEGECVRACATLTYRRRIFLPLALAERESMSDEQIGSPRRRQSQRESRGEPSSEGTPRAGAGAASSSESEAVAADERDAADAEADSCEEPGGRGSGALRLAYAEAVYHVVQGYFVLPLEDALTLAGLQLLCERPLLPPSLATGSALKAPLAAASPPPLEWYTQRLSDVLAAQSIAEHRAQAQRNAEDDAACAAEARRVEQFRGGGVGGGGGAPAAPASIGGVATGGALSIAVRRAHARVAAAAAARAAESLACSEALGEPGTASAGDPSFSPSPSAASRRQMLERLVVLQAQKVYVLRVRRLAEYGASFFVGEMARHLCPASLGGGSRHAPPVPAWAERATAASSNATSPPPAIAVLVGISHRGVLLRPMPPRHTAGLGYSPPASPMLSQPAAAPAPASAAAAAAEQALRRRKQPFVLGAHHGNGQRLAAGEPESFSSAGSAAPFQLHPVSLIEVWGVKRARPCFTYRVRERALVNIDILGPQFKEMAASLHTVVFALLARREGRARPVARDTALRHVSAAEAAAAGSSYVYGERVPVATAAAAPTTTTSLRAATRAAVRDARVEATAQLPAGWSEIVDPATGSTAWWHMETRVTVFSRPVV